MTETEATQENKRKRRKLMKTSENRGKPGKLKKKIFKKTLTNANDENPVNVLSKPKKQLFANKNHPHSLLTNQTSIRQSKNSQQIFEKYTTHSSHGIATVLVRDY